MEKIKEQIAELIKFKATTFDESDEEYKSLDIRIRDGIEKMKMTKIFTDNEIREVKEYAYTLLNNSYNAINESIITTLRKNFEF